MRRKHHKTRLAMDAVWCSEVAEVCEKYYPAWLRNARYWRGRLCLREEAYDIMARAIEYVLTHERPSPSDFAPYVFAKTKSVAFNLIHHEGRTCTLEFDLPAPEAGTSPEAGGEPGHREAEWNSYREQTARLRGDSFVHTGLFTQKKGRVEGVNIYSYGVFISKSATLGARTAIYAPSVSGRMQVLKVFSDRQQAVNEFYKYL